MASSNTVIKYWLYLRMLWLCQEQGEDKLVLEQIAHVEGFAPNCSGVSQRWDRVRRGLTVVEILLNHRQALVDLMCCSAVRLDQLIHLPVRYLQEHVLLHVVSQLRVAGDSRATVSATPLKMTIAGLQKMCRSFVDGANQLSTDGDVKAATLFSAIQQPSGDSQPREVRSKKRRRGEPQTVMLQTSHASVKNQHQRLSHKVASHAFPRRAPRTVHADAESADGGGDDVEDEVEGDADVEEDEEDEEESGGLDEDSEDDHAEQEENDKTARTPPSIPSSLLPTLAQRFS